MRIPRFKTQALWIAAGALALGGACTPKQVDPSLRIQLATEPASLDPTLAEDGASLLVLCNTMEGLVGYDGAGELKMLSAESYTVSADGLRYEFVLRPQARWSDGKPVTAGDFVTSFRRALTPGSGARLAGTLFPIRGAREFFEGKVGPDQVAVKEEGGRLVIGLKDAAPYFIHALTMPVALPERQDVLDAHGGKWVDTGPANGPYRIVSHQADRLIRFEKNPNYWSPSADFAPVEMVIVDDPSTALNLFEEGRLDILAKINPADLPRLLKTPGLVHTDPYLVTYYLSFNFRKPPFNDRIWRQAVIGAVRREEIVKALGEGGMPARSWVPPRLEGFIPYSDPAPVFAAAVAEARKRGAPSGPPIAAAFDTSSRNSLVMEKVQADLKKTLGLSITLSNLDWKTYLKTVHTEPPSLFRLGILSPFLDPIEILEAFTTGNPNNYLGWSNPEYDRRVAEIATLKPGAARERKIREAQEWLVDREAIVVPIYHYVQNHAVGPRVEGFRVNPFGVIRFNELRIRKHEGN